MITPEISTNDTVRRSETKHDASLTAEVLPRAALDGNVVDAMYRLYAACYAGTNAQRFRDDLEDKTHVLLLADADGELCGFSTLHVYASDAASTPVRVIYSGDTIIDPRHWGNSALAFEWLRFAGQVSRESTSVPLYWLLIVKGHRTYRYLSTFAEQYVPQHARSAEADELALLQVLAKEKFGDCFDANTGIVRFGPDGGRLTDALAEIPEKHQRLPAVRYFLEQNPGYKNGDELVCLCRLADDNLKPFAKRVFRANAGA